MTVYLISYPHLQVYEKVSKEKSLDTPTVDVSSKEFYGEGYDDSDKRIPDMTIINRQLGNKKLLFASCVLHGLGYYDLFLNSIC